MDVEDEESSPVVTTPINGNVPINPIIEQPAFINNQNGVSYEFYFSIILLSSIQYNHRYNYFTSPSKFNVNIGTILK